MWGRNMNKPLLILIAGGTASGKTTVVKKIELHFDNSDVSVVCMDNYYKKRDGMSLTDRKRVNYDHPDALDMDLLKQQLRELMNGNGIDCPVYNFQMHNRDDDKTIRIHPTKVIILEGILALYDEEIRNMANILIYVESEADIRFIRRLKRDMLSRGRSIDDVIDQYLSTVKPMYDAYVAPTKRFADIIIPNDTKHDMAIDILSAKIKDIVSNN